MLGKLLKYEIRSTSRMFLLLYSALMFLAVINKVLIVVLDDVKFLNIPRTLMMVVYIFLTIAMFVITIIIMIQRFYKNLLGEEGYLMFTLPVSPFKLIMSKLIVSVMWFFLSIAVTFISIIILLPDYRFLSEIPSVFAVLAGDFQQEFGFSINVLIWEAIAMIIVSLIYFIAEVYLAMAIGQFANKNRLLVSFASYMGVSFGVQLVGMIGVGVVSSIVTNSPITDASLLNNPSIVWISFLMGIFLMALLAAGFLFATNKILTKKLNIE